MPKKIKSKRKVFQTDTTVVEIKPWVLFRAGLQTGARKVAIHINNLEDDGFYEFEGRSAHLWLSIDGTRTIDEVIRHCKKIGQIGDLKFPALAENFLADLLEAKLIRKIKKKRRDIRADDMGEFSREIKRNLLRKIFTKNKRTLVTRGKSSDNKELLEVRRTFSKLLKTRARLKFKRVKTSFFGKGFHIFSADLSWPGAKGENPTGFGAALTVEGAAKAATGETVERIGVFSSRPTILSKSYNQLQNRRKIDVLDPTSCQIFAPHQDIIKTKEVFNLSRKTETNWILFEDAIQKGHKILIPEDLCGARFMKGPGPVLLDRTSNGCAAHTEINHAKLKATLELIERDNIIFYWRTKNTPALIDLARPNDRIGNLLEIMGELKKKVRLFYLRSELAPITVQATFFGNPSQGQPRFASTGATRLDPIDAMEKALIELIYVVSGTITARGAKAVYGKSLDNSIWDFADHGDFYAHYPAAEAYKFLVPRNPMKIHPSDIPSVETGDSTKNLEELTHDFRRHGLRLYYENTTPRYIRAAGFWVYRAFSPDLISIDAHHRFRMLGYPRYYKLPSLLGLKRRPKLPDQLNPWPHPIT